MLINIMSKQSQIITVRQGDLRLDQFLAKELQQFSRSFIKKMIEEGKIRLNSKLTKPATILMADDLIEISKEIFDIEPDIPLAEKDTLNKLDIIFENDDFLVINKPAGIVVHPAHANTSGTLVNLLLHHRPEISDAIYDPEKAVSRSRPGIIHRLDKDTSGIMIVAKTQESLVNLASKMSKKMIKKEYLALVYGWPKEVGKIHSFLGRSKKDRRKMASYNTIDEGKESVTDYQIVKYLGYKNQKIALLKAWPVTGRTHQIRLHLQSIGYPVIGDQQYFSKMSREISNKYKIERQLLHAERINFRYKGQDYCFCAKLPKDFQKFLEIFKEKHE